MFRAFAIAAIIWLVLLAAQGLPDELLRAENVVRILVIGIGGTLIPFSLYVWGIRHVRVERGIIVATLEPPFAAMIAWVWLGQALAPLQVVGGILVIAAVTTLQLLRVHRDRTTPDVEAAPVG